MSKKISLLNKKITVVGLGRSGFSAAKFLHEKKAIVRVTESSTKSEALENAGYLKSLGIPVEVGGHTQGFVVGSDWVVTSPGVPKQALPILCAQQNNIPIYSEVDLAALFCPCPIIGITGSNGKTTTANLIHRLIESQGTKSVLCGNVGYSFLDALSQMHAQSIAVAELSSFQLEDSPRIKPFISLVLNVSPNHLDRHKTMELYVAAKEKIFSNQSPSDWIVLNRDNVYTKKMAKKTKSKILFFGSKTRGNGFNFKNNRIEFCEKNSVKFSMDLSQAKLRGAHNAENIMAALAVAWILKYPMGKAKEVIEHFETLEHRIEPLGEVAGVYFVNDSKSTTVDSTRAALESMSQSVVWVAGGRDKGADFGTLEALIEKKVKKAIFYGEARHVIARSYLKFSRYDYLESFQEAIEKAYKLSQPGDTLLLSPMCTSFDQFGSYEERGQAFKKIFHQLKESRVK